MNRRERAQRGLATENQANLYDRLVAQLGGRLPGGTEAVPRRKFLNYRREAAELAIDALLRLIANERSASRAIRPGCTTEAQFRQLIAKRRRLRLPELSLSELDELAGLRTADAAHRISELEREWNVSRVAQGRLPAPWIEKKGLTDHVIQQARERGTASAGRNMSMDDEGIVIGTAATATEGE
jgi:hypothetical protein